MKAFCTALLLLLMPSTVSATSEKPPIWRHYQGYPLQSGTSGVQERTVRQYLLTCSLDVLWPDIDVAVDDSQHCYHPDYRLCAENAGNNHEPGTPQVQF